MACLTVEGSKYREDTLIEFFRLKAWVEAEERKVVKATEEVATVKSEILKRAKMTFFMH